MALVCIRWHWLALRRVASHHITLHHIVLHCITSFQDGCDGVWLRPAQLHEGPPTRPTLLANILRPHFALCSLPFARIPALYRRTAAIPRAPFLHIPSLRILSPRFPPATLQSLDIKCHAMPCHAMPCPVLPCPVLPRPAISYPVEFARRAQLRGRLATASASCTLLRCQPWFDTNTIDADALDSIHFASASPYPTSSRPHIPTSPHPHVPTSPHSHIHITARSPSILAGLTNSPSKWPTLSSLSSSGRPTSRKTARSFNTTPSPTVRICGSHTRPVSSNPEAAAVAAAAATPSDL
ncbi:uncharacterized protein BJ171DRAFT_112552 [Polychytrium aggregatum]|uniref:uncharacterized protein n=1 Tax=Polychytrium aggregatum TaxID=110093 RepID=UPI0022FE7F4C|nr:uncharacterized protein BJ171DRAFT_112552 [Polychytrium aggregatum]KAI9209288.1 hypothetical protein BJ171DRAFT_112552 [Polychytrium aggregatum]